VPAGAGPQCQVKLQGAGVYVANDALVTLTMEDDPIGRANGTTTKDSSFNYWHIRRLRDDSQPTSMLRFDS
jgi:hypothetical protein